MKKTVIALLMACAIIFGCVACSAAPENNVDDNTANVENSEVSDEASDGNSGAEGAEQSEKPSANGEGIVVGVATQHMGNAGVRNIVYGIQDILEPAGFEINHQDGGGETSAQVAAVETFVTQGVDYIIIAGGEGVAFNDVSIQAQKAGIPVVGVDMFLDGGVTGIMSDNWSGGCSMGLYAVTQMKGHGKYILLDTSGWATLKDRGEGAESVLSSFPNIQKIGSTYEVSAADPVTQGYEITKAALTADPDINAILVTWNMPAVGVYNALLEMNKVEDVAIVSADTGDDVISAMLEDTAGHWGFMGQNAFELGTLAGESVVKLVNGEELPYAQMSTTYFVTNDDYIASGIVKPIKFEEPEEHWKEVLENVLGPLEDYAG